MNSWKLIFLIVLARYVSGGQLGPDTHAYTDVEDSRQHLQANTQGWTGPRYSGPTAIPVVRSDGTIADTPEVADARAIHLAALEYARATNPDMDDGQYDPQKYGDQIYDAVSEDEDNKSSLSQFSFGSHHNINKAEQSPTGYVADTETRLAQWMLNNAALPVSPAVSYGPPSAQNSFAVSGGYFNKEQFETEDTNDGVQNELFPGSLAIPRVLPTGYLADTQEVAAARRIHLGFLAEAEAAARAWRETLAQKRRLSRH